MKTTYIVAVVIVCLFIINSLPVLAREKGDAQGCAGYAAFETVHMVLHMENISHAEATDLINKSPKARKAWDENYEKCMKLGTDEVKIHHYCRPPESWDEFTPYKCDKYEPWEN